MSHRTEAGGTTARRLTLQSRELAEVLRAEPWLSLPPAFVPREAGRGSGRGLARLTPAARAAVIGGLALHQQAALGVSLRGWRAGLHIVAEYAVLGNRGASLLRVEAAGPDHAGRRAGTRVRASVFPARVLPEEMLRLVEGVADSGGDPRAAAIGAGTPPGRPRGPAEETVLTIIPRLLTTADPAAGARESFAAMRSWVVGASGWQTPIPDPAAGGAPRWLRVAESDLRDYVAGLLLAAATTTPKSVVAAAPTSAAPARGAS